MLNKTFQIIYETWQYVSIRRRYHVLLLLVVTVVSGFCEIASIGAIIPFLGVLLTPEKALEFKLFEGITQFFGADTQHEIIVLLTTFFLLAISLSALVRGFLLWLNIRVSHAVGADFEREVYRRSIYQPYEVHAQRNASTVTASVLKTGAVTAIILSALNFVHGTVIMLFIVAGVIYIDPYFSLGMFAVIGSVYLVVMTFTRLQLLRNGRMIARNTSNLLKWMQESLGGIRDILLEGRQKQYCDHFGKISVQIKRAAGSNLLIGQGPRMIVEPVGIMVIAMVACYSALSGNFSSQLPFFGALALAAQRLLPTVQQMYAGWSAINSCWPQTIDVFEILKQPVPQEYLEPVSAPAQLRSGLSFKNVGFSYKGSAASVLNGVSLEIRKGQCIGIIGRSGSGKSTLLDLILGLLSPTSGIIEVDQQVMTGAIRQGWQRSIAHVPQDIYLNDATIAENIAFGVEKQNIDLDRVQEAARRAQLGEVIAQLPAGLDTIVGERGKQLSGGQRQRIGIARALYKKTPVMVFDEATSALDTRTEQNVINEIMTMTDEVTLIIVTHRLQTLENCDIIHVVDRGAITASGSYQEVICQHDLAHFTHDHRDTKTSSDPAEPTVGSVMVGAE
ncbi:MAG: ABC transporter ATP-binding protein [Methyloligellaceae bacterium]